jgi:hypothetical protein
MDTILIDDITKELTKSIINNPSLSIRDLLDEVEELSFSTRFHKYDYRKRDKLAPKLSYSELLFSLKKFNELRGYK